MYRSVTAQTIHYLARAHAAVPTAPIASRAAWLGADLDLAGHRLSEAEVEEIDAALALASTQGKPLGQWTRRDFPLPKLGPRIAAWRRQLVDGTGVQLIRGLPVARWGQADSERFFWALGLHLGQPGAQNGRGELLGHVTRLDAADAHDNRRQYQTDEAIAFHCDAADVVGLLCLRPAVTGGESRIASSVTIYNELLATRPDLAPLLFDRFWLDTRGDGFVRAVPVRPARYSNGVLRTFYHGGYFRSARRPSGGAALDAKHQELVDAYDEIASRPEIRFNMALAPGDVQLLSNHVVVHSRTGYVDAAEPDHRRHLLRLWLSLEREEGITERLRREHARLQLLGSLAITWGRERIAGK
ncbi:MAG: TauD/TfdA family dioxygenase [Pseudomonadota bacterium]